MLAVDVLDAPEAAGGDGAALCAFWNGSGGSGFRNNGESCSLRKRPEQPGEEVERHVFKSSVGLKVRD